jgi:cellulose synthase/poly-beta-1,6-N-acetylglucosamine synthase-like glycosyltransferase
MGFTFIAIWFWVTALLALVWLKRHIDLARGRREPVLRAADSQNGPDHRPALSVLVAAKDEEANIGRCVSGLLAQDYAHLQVVAINDRSADRTGAIIDELAGHDPRLTAVHIQDLPAGWFGKNNAMMTGVGRATADWFCFTDADCVFDSPHLLSAAVSFARRERLEFLSVLPTLETATFWERVVQPVAGAILVYWNPPQKVNDPRSRCAYANGAFMLMTRAAYERLGTHAAVKATLNEDMHMARRAKAVGIPFRVIRGGGMYRCRMYTGFGQIWRGWSRIFYGCFGTPGKLIGSILALSLASVSPYVTLALSPLAGWSAGAWLAGAAVAAIVAQQSVLWRFYRLSGQAGAWALTYPLGAVLCVGMTLAALRKALGAATTTWRGTTYAGGS